MSWAAEEWRAAEVSPACRNTKAACSLQTVQEVSHIRAALILHYWTQQRPPTTQLMFHLSLVHSENLRSFWAAARVKVYLLSNLPDENTESRLCFRTGGCRERLWWSPAVQTTASVTGSPSVWRHTFMDHFYLIFNIICHSSYRNRKQLRHEKWNEIKRETNNEFILLEFIMMQIQSE